MMLILLLQQLILVSATFLHPGEHLQHPFSTLQAQTEWELLRGEVGDRLSQTSPFASACYDAFDSEDCVDVRNSYLDIENRTNSPAAYIQTQWETCQSTEDTCDLDSTAPHNSDPTRDRVCDQGSVSSWVIEVKNSNDVKAAFRYAKETKTHLVVQNTGHDYKGRSSAPGSLALWMHNLKGMSSDPEFVAEGCSKETTSPQSTVTLQAGVQWGEAYAFAEENNITILGGADGSVGAVGGWLQGGGHGVLSNTMGLGVDRVVQFKVVTPDGQSRIANDCQNQDLFFALRGGGAGTFGVVMEATVLASPPTELQVVIVAFSSPNSTRTAQAWSLLAEHGLRLSQEGWGGYSNAQAIILVNPILSSEEATRSAAAIIGFGKQINDESPGEGTVFVAEFPTFKAFFQFFNQKFVAVQGQNLALASRLIPKDSFRDRQKSAKLVSALLTMESLTPGVVLLMTTPASVPSLGKTSVPEAWRESLFHVTAKVTWQWGATREGVSEHYRRVSSSMDELRRITPHAAYMNEADVYEPNFQVSFWGHHYERLLEIKRKYDPEHLLDCWHCVGWNPSSSRFTCYLPVKQFE